MMFDKFQGRRDSSRRRQKEAGRQGVSMAMGDGQRNRQGTCRGPPSKGDRQRQSSIQMGDSQRGQTRRLEQDGGNWIASCTA